MTTRVISSELWAAFGRLGKRLRLKDAPEQTGVSPIVQAVTDFDELLRSPQVESVTVDLSGTSGVFTAVATVPSGQRWKLTFFDRNALASVGAATLRIGGVEVSLQGPGTSRTFLYFQQPFLLDEGDAIGVTNTGDGTDNARVMTYVATKEDSF